MPAEASKRDAKQETIIEDVKVQSSVCTSEQRTKLLEFADQLALPELCHDERLSIAAQLLMLFNVFGAVQEQPLR